MQAVNEWEINTVRGAWDESEKHQPEAAETISQQSTRFSRTHTHTAAAVFFNLMRCSSGQKKKF
jgi:hypothetical protein